MIRQNVCIELRRKRVLLTSIVKAGIKLDPNTLRSARVVLSNKQYSSILAIPIGSGQTWTSSVLNCYLNFKLTESFDGQYLSGFDTGKNLGVKYVRSFEFIELAGAFNLRQLGANKKSGYVIGGHPTYSKLCIFGMRDIRVVFVSRELVTAVYAKAKKNYELRGNNIYFQNGKCIFDIDKLIEIIDSEVLPRYLEFYNSWGLFCAKRSNNECYHFKFENLKEDPIAGFDSIVKVLLREKELDHEYLRKSVEQAELSNAKKAYMELNGKNDTIHVGHKGAVSYDAEMPDIIREFILDELKSKLVYREAYPYELEWCTS